MGLTNEYDASGAGLYTDEQGNALDSMLIVGESPWHFAANEKLIRLRERGTKIHPLEVNKAAGLDWAVENMPEWEWLTRFAVSAGADQSAAERLAKSMVLTSDFVNTRSDSLHKIGNVKRGYQVYQNEEAPEFMMNLVDSGDLAVETAFSLYDGRKIVWTFRMPEGIIIGGDKNEAVDMFLCLMNSHDGSQAITIFVTPVRVVCQNTLGWGLKQATRVFRVRHTKNAEEKMREARRALEIGFAYSKELEALGTQMVETSFSDADLQAFLDSLVPVPAPNFVNQKQTNLPAITMAKKKQQAIVDIYEQHPTQLQIRGTLWGAVQAVQFFADHVATAKYTPQARFRRAVIAKNLGTEAFARALELVA